MALFECHVTVPVLIDQAPSSMQELKEKCHPLGVFDNMERLAVAANMTELYDLVLRDTPLGHYFSASLTSEDLDEMNLEILRNTLYKAYLDDFAKLCSELGGATADIMGEMMQFEVRCVQPTALQTYLCRLPAGLPVPDRFPDDSQASQCSSFA